MNIYSDLNVSGQKDILNIEEVAQLTGLSKSTVYKLTSKHEIPYYKPAGRKHLHFRHDEIMAWMLRGRIKTNEELEQEAIKRRVDNLYSGRRRKEDRI